jgi:hypothetical protein
MYIIANEFETIPNMYPEANDPTDPNMLIIPLSGEILRKL